MARSEEDAETLLTQLATTIWGRFGNNGLNAEVRHHGEQIGDLYGRDDTLRNDINLQLGKVEERMSDGFKDLYRLITILLVTVLGSALGIIGTLLVAT